MTVAKSQSACSPPGFLRVLGTGLAVGGVGGLLFAVRDSARAVFLQPHAARGLPYGAMLHFGLNAAGRYALLGGAFLGVVGAGLGLLVVAGRARVSRSGLPACLAGVLVFFVLFVAQLEGSGLLHGPLWPARLWAVVEAGLVSAACGAGAALAVQRLAAARGDGRRLLAAAAGALAGLFVLANWGLWLYLAVLHNLGRLGRGVGWATLVGVAALLAAGLYLLLAPSGTARGRRRRAAGALALVLGLGAWAGGHALLAARGLKTPAAPAVDPGAQGKRRPNVLWIVMDAARADALSCYGCPRETTPHLDALAAEGVLYEQAFAVAPWTLPSHASMFTGMLPSRHGTTAEHQYLEDRFTTIAELLAARGYRTLGYSNNYYVSRVQNLAQGFGEFRCFLFGRTWRTSLLANRFHPELHLDDYGARETTDTVVRWIEARVAAAEPFFVFINYMEPHGEYGVTPLYRRWLPPGARLPAGFSATSRIHAYCAGEESYTPEEVATLRALYDSDVAYLDTHIGRLLAHLRGLGVLDETLVIVTSDHGEHFGEHHLLDHLFSMYNPLLHVPLIVRYPGGSPRGLRLGAAVQTVDLFPTLLDVLGIAWDGRGQLQGRPLPRDAEEAPTVPPVAEYALPIYVVSDVMRSHKPFDAAPVLRRLKCVQAGGHKYIWASDGRHELYHLQSDPGEERNVLAAAPAKARELHALLEARLSRPVRPGPMPAAPASERRAP